MGQYFAILNLDRKEYLTPYWFGNGLTLPDIARPGEGIMTGLALLLALSGTNRYATGPIYGRWAGAHIAIVGDYYAGAVAGQAFDEDIWTSITNQEDGWVDISEHVRRILEVDWNLPLPPPQLDGAEPRSLLHADGTATAIPRPIWDNATGTWVEPSGGEGVE